MAISLASSPSKVLASVARRIGQLNDPRLSRDFAVLEKHYLSLLSRNSRLLEVKLSLETNLQRTVQREIGYEKEVLTVAEELIQLKRETGRIGL